MNHHHNLRLTPSNSPFFKNSQLRSPTKVNKSEEPGLRLKAVIGTTTASANGFDCLPSARQFAYTAGAAAVVATVEEDLKITQRFFRARPNVAAPARDANGVWPISPTPADPRTRVLGNVRDQGVGGGSPLGTPGRDWSDSPGGKSATAKDRVKAATSVALSPNGKWLAVGETGYKPRVLVFSNKGESSETPVSALAEHTFGVHALAFSSDSKYLASLGTVNDGFLYLWSINDRTGAAALHSSNKCTVTINCMIWVGQSVLTVGLRFVKLWRPDEDILDGGRNPEAANVGTPKIRALEFGNSILSPKQRVLPGKNILLGGLLDANFVVALPVSVDQAIICADSGEICFLYDSDKTQSLSAAATVGFRITSARLDEHGGLFVIGATGFSRKFDVRDLEQRTSTPSNRNRRQTISLQKALPPETTTTTAMATIENTVVELDSKRHIRLTRSDDDSGSDVQVASHQLAAHDEGVLGVQALDCEILLQAAFLTFAGNGAVHLWDADGTSVSTLKVPIETSSAMCDTTNELRAVAHVKKASVLAACDKYGVLSLLDISSGSVLAQIRAHATEVAQIVAFERAGTEFIATASRDRTVQLFVWNGDTLDLLQTMDEHAAAVNGLLVVKDGEIMLSCSSDRTIVVREAMLRVDGDPTSLAFVMLRTITLKASPTSMCLTEDDDEILVSTIDRCIGRYSIKTGQAGFSFKCSDAEGGEAASMSKILYAPSLKGDRTIMGVSTSDKSVRLYSEYGSLMARDWGHTEAITDVALLASRNADEDEQKPSAQLVTVATDSTIFMWDTVSSTATVNGLTEVNGVCESPTISKLTPMAPPLRKVISYSELSRFKRGKSIDENEPSSPIDVPSRQRSPSPQRVKKKKSRISLAQAPRLEPAFRSSFAESNRRRSLRKRSPSPPSPRMKRDHARRPSLGMSLRSKSSENVLSSLASNGSTSAINNSSFGSLTSSTDSTCRMLRAYRKKLSNSTSSENIAPETLRELEKELKLLARAVGEKAQGKNFDEAKMAKLLDQASEKIVSRLDERIKERVESEVRKSSEGSPTTTSGFEPANVDAVTGALEKVTLDST